MAVQITGRQIANAAVGVAKLDLSTGTFDFQNAVLQVATPTEGDAANRVASKGYVDGVAQGLDIKDSCKAATTANITLSGAQTIDGITIGAGDRVLVKDQSTQTENGIYIASASGWSRAADFAAGAAEAGAFTFVEQGTVNGDNGFVCTSDKGSDVVGTNNIVFSQFSGAGQITAGLALTKVGNTLNVATDDSSIEISSDALQVKSGGITNTMLAGSIAASKLAGSIPADKLNLGNGVEESGGNLIVSLDGTTLALGAGGLSVAAGGIGSTQLASDSVVSAKIADGAIDSAAYIADSLITNAKLAGSIANAKLANSTVSFGGVSLALGSSDATPAFDLADATNYPTSALVGTISSSQLAADCVTNAKIADDAIKTENLDFAGFFQGFDADGSTLAFELAGPVDLEFKQFFTVTVNGLVMEYKDTPDAQDNYKIDNGGAGGAGRIVFGANLANGDRVTVRGFINN